MAERIPAKQRRTRFIKEYLLDHNATRAAIAAGYSQKGAETRGSELLRDSKVREALEAENDKINAKLDITVERVKTELAKLAFFDPRIFFKPDGSLKAITEFDAAAAACIAGIEVTELFSGNGDDRAQVGYLKKIKLADKGINLERLGRHLQMFPTKVDVNATLEIHKVDDANLEQRIAQLERDLGLARAIDEAGRIGIAQAGVNEATVAPQNS